MRRRRFKTTRNSPSRDLQSGLYTIVARAISRDLVYSPPLNVQLRIQSAPFLGSRRCWRRSSVAVAAAALAFRQQFRLASANRALEKTNIELTETRLRLANETEAERSRIARDLHDQTLADLRHLLVMTDQLPGANSSSTTPDDSTPSPSALRREIEGSPARFATSAKTSARRRSKTSDSCPRSNGP